MDEKTLTEKLRKRVRVMSDSSDEEIMDLVESCKIELEMAGVYGDESDPTYYQAVVLYCKGNFGYDDDTERFQLAFAKLRDAMSLSGDYDRKEGGSD
jgi:hypothetical protein